MRAVIQRVISASVSVEAVVVGEIGRGYVVLLGVEESDTLDDIDWLDDKIVNLRLFAGDPGGMERNILEVAGGILLVSQFTLFASTKKGARPSWHRAARPALAQPLCESMSHRLGELLGRPVANGRFGAMMQVAMVNDGPVTLVIDTKARE